MSLYLDHNATNLVDPRVVEEMVRVMRDVYGNAGSGHAAGRRAKQLVHQARDAIGNVVGARRHEVIFTSGATEANNLAILGLEQHGRRTNRRHIVSTQIEHKAVLEPLAELQRRGFEITLVAPEPGGFVRAESILAACRPNTLLVSVMHVNNETGVVQPIADVASGLAGIPENAPPLLHVDAAQGFGKVLPPLKHDRIDLISISGHKINGPQGIGALVTRRREGDLPPLSPILFGGGQELGLRSGTLPVPLIAGFGKAADLAAAECESRAATCRRLRQIVLDALNPLTPTVHGDPQQTLPHVINVSFPGWDADSLMETLDEIVAVSDGAACTSVCATASHVLAAMGVPEPQLSGAVRFSWSHLTPAEGLEDSLKHVVQKINLQAR